MHGPLAQEDIHVAVDLMILSVEGGTLRVLLSRRKAPPFEGMWALPGCFVGRDESAEQAAGRLLVEMRPPEGVYLEQLYTFTAVDRDPRGRVISVGYLAVVPAGRQDAASAEGSISLCPFTVEGEEPRLTGPDGETLDPSLLAFDHAAIIRMGILRLRGKIAYTDIAFRFLRDPACFSLGEMQTVFEAVLGRALDASNFRRSILGRYVKTGRIVQTDRLERSGRGRPSGLYRLAE